MAFDFLKLSKSVSDIGARVNEIVAELEQAIAERKKVAAAPLTREDLIGFMCGWVDRVKSRYPRSLEIGVGQINHAGGKMEQTMPNGFLCSLTSGIENGITPEALCFLLEGQIKDGLRRAVEEMPYIEEGEALPRAEQKAKLVELDKKIVKLADELDNLYREADVAGVVFRSVPELPVEIRRELGLLKKAKVSAPARVL